MNIKNHDLNLLHVFRVIAEECHLGRAGKRLGLSQPALSHALKRLRGEFGDPLFVRASRGLAPTPRANALLPEIRLALNGLESLYRSRQTTDFSALRRNFVLGATTYFEMRSLPRVLAEIARHAPEVTLESRALTDGFPARELEDGTLDVAVAAYFDRVPEGFRIRSLGKDPHVCVMRKKHPLVRAGMTLERYLAATHVKIGVPPNRVSAVDRALEEHKRARRIVASLANFIVPPMLLIDSDHLLTCPQSLAQKYAELFGTTWTKLPIAVPPIEIRMVWHERNHADPFQQWMRETIVG